MVPKRQSAVSMVCLLRINQMDRTPLFALTLNVGDVASRTGPDSKALSAPGAPRRQLRCAQAWGKLKTNTRPSVQILPTAERARLPCRTRTRNAGPARQALARSVEP